VVKLRALGMKMPELVLHLDEAFGRTEADEEIQEFTAGESRKNLHCTPLAYNFDPVVTVVDPAMASQIVCWTRISLMSTVLQKHQYVDLQRIMAYRSRRLYFHHSLTNGKSMPKVLCLNQRPRIVAASVSAG
jgi:hypothetical protein